MSDPESRKLSDLRVVDLRSELEKRGLDKGGNKQALLDRLQKALKDEGLDAETYQFDNDKKPTKRLSTSSSHPEVESNQKELHHNRVNIEDDIDDVIDVTDNALGIELQEELDTAKKKSAMKEKAQMTEAKAQISTNKSANIVKAKTKIENKVTPTKRPIMKKVGSLADPESPLRLTLEEGEAFQDEIDLLPEPVRKPVEPVKPVKPLHGDKKNTTNKNQEHAGKAIPINREKTLDSKKQAGITTSLGPSIVKLAFKSKKSGSQNRNLWITNISQTTRATELKQALSSYGKVIGAKVVINAKYPGACCYGYVTMDTVKDADNCLTKLNNTELNGQIIRIEKVRPDHMNSIKLNPRLRQLEGKRDDMLKSKPMAHKPLYTMKYQERKDDMRKFVGRDDDRDEKRDDRKDGRSDDHRSDTSSDRRRDFRRVQRSRSFDRFRERDHQRSESKGSRPRHSDKDVLTFDKIKDEREKQRIRDRERVVREESRRRREEAAHQREVERMQRSEAARLDREREKLRIEREKLEREKAEIIRLERDRQKMERDKLEMEKMELHRAKMRLQEQDRRAVKRSAPYRRESSYEDRKRATGERRYEESSPSHFDASSVKAREPTPPAKKFGSAVKDYKPRVGYDKRESFTKRDRDFEPERPHVQTSLSRSLQPTSITKYEGSSVFNISRERDMHDTRPRDNSSVSNSRISKDSRYNERERERSPHYRSVRDDRDRRGMPDHKGGSRDHRYNEPNKDVQRFDRNTGGNNWNHPGGNNKVFNTGGGPHKGWNKDWRGGDSSNSDRWNSGGVSRGASSLSAGAFSGNSNLNLGPSCPPPPAINNYGGDRFDYKSMGNIRKY